MAPSIGAVREHFAEIIRQRRGAGLAVVDVGRRDGDLLHQCGLGVGSDMGLEAMNRRSALVLDPMRLAVALAGGGDDGRIDQRARLQPDRPRFELGGDRLEQGLVQPARRQRLAKAHEGGPFRRRLQSGEPAEP